MSVLRKNSGWAWSVAALMATTAPALAQEQNTGPDQSGDSTDDNGLQDIVVTAQRRSEGLLGVPLSISAITGTQLETSGIRQLTDLQFVTPGYNVSDSSGYTQIFIRGVGNSIFLGADPSVATFIDDVPRIYGSMVNNFVDVERVEILKGAQGGLYGRNATGGVVNIITRQPTTDEVKGEARVSYGTRETFQASGYVNLPISDRLAISFAAERRSHAPYIKNTAAKSPYTASMFPSGAFLPTPNGTAPVSPAPGVTVYSYTPAQTAAYFNSGVDVKDVNNENFWAVSTKILFKPTDNLKITIAGDYNRKDDTNGNAIFSTTPGLLQQVVAGTFASVGITTDFPAGLVQGNPSAFTVQNGTSGFSKNTDYGVSGTVVWSPPNVDVMSISAYRNQHTYFQNELIGSSVPFQTGVVNNHKHYFYQELRLISTFAGPLQLIGGATYLNSEFNGSTDFNLLTPFAVGVPLARSVDRVKNYSVYGQARYEVTDNLSLTISGRYVHETNEAFFPLSGTPFRLVEGRFLPSATVSYKLEGGGNIYARWARGFKSGGINQVADPSAFGNRPDLGSVFKGETVDTYELGYRSALFDRKVQLTAAIFYNDYQNLQTSAHANAANANTIIFAIINAGTARSYGGELSLTWRVIDPLTLSFSGGYLNAKYKHFLNTDSTKLVPFDLSGTRMTNSPEVQLSFTANLDQPISDRLRLVANTLVSYTSDVIWQPSGNAAFLPDSAQSAYWIANARIGVRTADDKYGFAVFGNNIFNQGYTVYGNSAEAGGNSLVWGNPRIIGAEASMKF